MVGEYFGVNQIDWQASRGKDTGSPFAMTSEPRLDVIGFADVKRAIRTAQNVHEVHATTTMASSIAWSLHFVVLAEGHERGRPSTGVGTAKSRRSRDLRRELKLGLAIS